MKGFDPKGLHALVDGIRLNRGVTWNQMARQAGISASTMTRLGQGRSPDVNGLSAIVTWSGLDAADVLGTRRSSTGDTVTAIRLALRNDQRLARRDAEAIGDAVQSLYASMSSVDAN